MIPAVADDLTIRSDAQAVHLFGRTWLLCPVGSCNRVHGHLGGHHATKGRHRPTVGRTNMSRFVAGDPPRAAAPAPWPPNEAKAPAPNLPGCAREDGGDNPGPANVRGDTQPARGDHLSEIAAMLGHPW